MLGPVVYLAGGSFDRHCANERELRARLGPHFASWTGQADIHRRQNLVALDQDVPRRLRALEATLRELGPTRNTILIGRSSGARVATLFSLRNTVAAVVCISYPFQSPRADPEPQRFAHLAVIETPTLMAQGVDDPYGGSDVTERYDLSDAITVHFLQATHNFSQALTSEAWDGLADTILSFCAGAAARPARPPTRFDERHYRTAHPMVSRAIDAGRFESGMDHYRAVGCLAGYRGRLLPRDGAAAPGPDAHPARPRRVPQDQAAK
jgi:predicted alpha/beta-hydrolase family hydrolase